MDIGYFKQKVNFWVSVGFIGAFALFLTTTVLDVAHMNNPITRTQPQMDEIGF